MRAPTAGRRVDEPTAGRSGLEEEAVGGREEGALFFKENIELKPEEEGVGGRQE